MAAPSEPPTITLRGPDKHSCHVCTSYRYLKAWDIEDAAKEFLLWGTYQQVDCLTSLDAYTAAAILTRVPEALRKDLLGMLEPFVAANILQVCAVW